MVRPHMALPTGAGQPRDLHRTGVTGVARRAGADRSVWIRAAHAMALFATAGHRGTALGRYKRMRRPARPSRLIGLGEIHLLRGQPFLTIDRRPSRRRMPAARE